jgi:surface polysaccharide O-acyltransferase-like enzyme
MHSSIQTKWMYWIAAIAYMGMIFWLSSLPGEQAGIPAPWDKLVHGIVYGVLGALLYKATRDSQISWLIAVLYGLSDEIHQGFTPGRYLELGDWVADSLGAAIGIWLVVIWNEVASGRAMPAAPAQPEPQKAELSTHTAPGGES